MPTAFFGPGGPPARPTTLGRTTQTRITIRQRTVASGLIASSSDKLIYAVKRRPWNGHAIGEMRSQGSAQS